MTCRESTYMSIMDKKTKELRSIGKTLTPILNVGKSGLTESMITEIKRQLQKQKLIKIKMRTSSLEGVDKKAFAKEIAEKTEAQLIEQVGFVLVLHKKD
jgi:RNA-binding protein